jgi:DNA ligase-1
MSALPQNPWSLQYDRGGVLVRDVPLWLDPHVPQPLAFVSHAHFDHLARHDRVIVSEATARLIQKRYPAIKNLEAHPFMEPFAFDEETTLTLVPAGHIFGSAQLLIEQRGRRLLYTGDFKLRPGLSSEPCQAVPADTLIMETTYGLPQYVFPPSSVVLEKIVQFCRESLEDGETPILFGYSLGKSQEILRALSEAALPIMLHRSVAAMTEIYQELGVTFPPFERYRAQDVAGHVFICPPNASNGSMIKKIHPRRTAAVSGWALAPGAIFRFQCDTVFPLSDHAGYDDLLAYVAQVGPRQVYTLHGFAGEFAATLRGQGMAAWALTGDDQMELLALNTGPHRQPTGSEESGEMSVWDVICQSLERAAATTRKSTKVGILAELLRAAAERAEGELIALITMLSGNPGGVVSGTTKALAIGPSIIRRAAQTVAGIDRGEYRQVYLRHQDTGLTVQEILVGRTRSESADAASLLGRLAKLAGTSKPSEKLGGLENLFRSLSPLGTKWLVRIMTGDLRAGLKEGMMEEAVAEAFAQPLEAVKLAHMLTGELGEAARLALTGRLNEAQLRCLQPIRFMLASPEPSERAILERTGGTWAVEDKFDGIRCQLHKAGGEVRLFSRDLRDVTQAFPEIVAAARHLSQDVVLDGELLAFAEGRALPFAELQKRLGRKEADLFMQDEVPLCFQAFDCLYAGGSQIGVSWQERRKRLEQVVAELPPEQESRIRLSQVYSASTEEELAVLFQRARDRGNEGLMIKDPESLYSPGKRGLAWLKLKKAFATLDVVVTAVEWGHGKRKGFLSDYTFAVRDEGTGGLKTIGKAYSGLTDAELAEWTAIFQEETIEVIKGRRHLVEPRRVIEVAFDSIQPSDRHDSGLSLRFPRIVRIRKDKGPGEIDTLTHCRRLAGV